MAPGHVERRLSSWLQKSLGGEEVAEAGRARGQQVGHSHKPWEPPTCSGDSRHSLLAIPPPPSPPILPLVSERHEQQKPNAQRRPSAPSAPSLLSRGLGYSLLASASLSLENAKEGSHAHSLSLLGKEDSPSWLPLYGTMCCRLVAQPDCMTRDATAGFLNEQPSGGVLGETWRRRYCVLRGGRLLCFSAPEEREAATEPALSVPINRGTQIRPVDKEVGGKANLFSVINPEPGEAAARVFQAESRPDLRKWMEAFRQHFLDFSQWKHCCEEFMRMETGSPQKPPLFLAKEATSVYQELSIDSPVKPDPVAATAQGEEEEEEEEEEESRLASLAGLVEADVSYGSSLKQSGSSPQGSPDSEGISEGREPPSRP